MNYIEAAQRDHERDHLKAILTRANQERLQSIRSFWETIATTPPEALNRMIDFVLTASDEELAAAMEIADTETEVQRIIDRFDDQIPDRFKADA